jgi:hypothetical protein
MDILHPASSIEIAWWFMEDNFFCHPSVMYRKEVYSLLGGYPEEAAEDYAYFSQVVQKFQCYNIPKILLDYREHIASLSNLNSDNIQNSVAIISKANYKYYLGDLEHYAILNRYQREKEFKFTDSLTLLMLIIKSMNVIRKNYHIPFSDHSFWKVMLKQQAKVCQQMLVKIRNKILRH